MKKIVLLTLAVSFFAQAQAQTQTIQITTGTSYKKQTFLNLKTGVTKTNDNTAWDIAFTVYGQQDAGVFLNESVGTGTPPQAALRLYKAPSDNFTENISVTALKDSLENDEKNWSFGAFNAGNNPAAYNYGWGVYSPGSMGVVGSKVFIVKLRNGKYRKLEIKNLAGSVYNFRHANLDGSDEKVVAIDKKNHAGKTLAYYSIVEDKVADVEVDNGFDILYTRYYTPLDQGSGVVSPYPVAGILTGRDVQTARVTGKEPSKVVESDFNTKFEKKTDIIGHDWKTFSLQTNAWSVPTDRTYIVKTRLGDLYKMVFIDFEGSTTGTATAEVNKIVTIAVNDISKAVQFNVYPTVVNNDFQLIFDNKNNEQYEVVITDMMGRQVQRTSLDINSGLQAYNIEVADFTQGTYVVTLASKKGVASSRFVKL